MSQTENDLYKQALAVYLNSEKDTRPYWETDHRGMVLPLVKSGYNNSVSYGLPGILGGSAPSVLNDILQGRSVAQGEIEQGASDAAGAAMTGSFAFGRPAGSIGSGGRVSVRNIGNWSQEFTSTNGGKGYVDASRPLGGTDVNINSSSNGGVPGSGLAMYRALIDAANKRGLSVQSDEMVSESAKHVYDALARRGHRVTQNPDAVKADGTWLAPQGQSVFDVGPSPWATYANAPTSAAAPSLLHIAKTAARDLPMDQASRLARAKEMGFDTDTTWYHGTDKVFDAFDNAKIKAPEGDKAHYFTRSLGEAADYADQNDKGGSIIPAFLNPSQMKRVDLKYRLYDLENAEMLDQAKREGYNGILAYINGKPDVAMVTDPRNIRSVNATFDPEMAWSANLLAANAPTSAAAPSLQHIAQTAAREQTPGIRAYHGSPHDYNAERLVRHSDGRTEYIVGEPNALPAIPSGATVLKDFPLGRVRLDKIGSGEGAQAYGYGWYAADNEGVAKSYRDGLSHGMIKAAPQTEVEKAAAEFWKPYVNTDGASIHDARSDLAYAVKTGRQPAEVLSAFDAMAADGRLSVEKNPGRLYEVNIKADPEHFLDWDKPLSQQSEKVRGVLEPQIDNLWQERERQRLATYDALIRKGSRNSAERDFGKPVPRDDRELMQSVINAGPEREKIVSQALREAGVPGIKYLDQGSRGAGEGSRNYVVFSDDIVEILRKYGLAGLSILGGASAINNDPQSRQ